MNRRVVRCLLGFTLVSTGLPLAAYAAPKAPTKIERAADSGGNPGGWMQIATVSVLSPSPDHFSFSTIPMSQTSAVPFNVTITARDATNGIYTDFTGTVSLTATGTVGAVSLSPSNSGVFAGGQWTGSLTVKSVTLSAVQLTANDGAGHSGQSGTFYVIRPASNTLIPATNRVDMVADATHGLLYITTSNQVLRYDLNAGAFLTPFVFGSNLTGIDISRDDSRLIVADASYNSNEWVWVVELSNGAFSKVQVPTGAEAGSWAVAFGNNGKALVTFRTQGCCSAPLRQCDPVGSSLTTVTDFMNADSMVSASGDGRIVGVAEAHVTGGHVDSYDVVSETLRRGADNGTGYFDYEIGVNRDGTQYAIPTYGGTFLYNTNLAVFARLGTAATEGPIGAAYDPTADVVFFPWWPTSYVRVLETHTLAEVTRYDCAYTFGFPSNNRAFLQGRIRTSRDGNNVFVTVGNGVRWISRGRGLPADLALSLVDSLDPVGTGSNLTYTIVVTNSSLNSVSDAKVFDRLPVGVSFTSASVSQGTWSLSNGVVVCALGALAGGASATINVGVVPPIQTILTNVAALISSAADPNPTNDSATILTTVQGVAGLGVTPLAGLSSAGPVGGPFSPVSQVYMLTNNGTAPLAWSATNTTSWVSLSTSGGNLPIGGTTGVTISVNSNAISLAAGSYSGSVTFSNVTNGNGTTNRSVALSVNEIGVLSVSPPAGLTSSGPVGGPFSPSNQVYTLINSGGTALNWSSSKGQNWLSLSATSGVLTVGATATITASINSAANGLTSGSYSDHMVFSNLTSGVGGGVRDANLVVRDITVWSVTSAADSGAGTLRTTLASIQSYDVINFALPLPASINLTSGELLVTNSVTILGPGPTNLIINGNAAGRVFHIGPSNVVSISGVTVTNGVLIGDLFTAKNGGGILNDGAELTISNCVISGNSVSPGSGGGIYNAGDALKPAILTTINSTITGNGAGFSSSAGGGRGAGIANLGSATLWATGCTIIGNSAGIVGGGAYNGGGSTMTIANCVVANNTSPCGACVAGGLYNASAGTLTASETTIVGNYAQFGGGISSDGKLTVSRSTITANNAHSDIGGGIYSYSGTALVQGSIVAGNSGHFGATDVNGAFTSGGYNLIGTTSGSSGFGVAGDLIGLNPMLGPLQDNGGLTKTCSLLPGSPAINAGDPSFFGPPAFDQRGYGFPRIVGGRVDVGAYETPDSVGDGIPDSWRSSFFGGSGATTNDFSCASCNPDGDGFSNLQEYLTGTDPTNGASAFRILGVIATNNDILVTWATAGGRTNVMQSAPDLTGSYTNVSPNIVVLGTGDMTTNYLDSGGATNGAGRFYRIRLVP